MNPKQIQTEKKAIESKPIEETKELITTGKIPVEKLEETMEKILGIVFDKDNKKDSNINEPYSSQSDNDV